MAHWSVFSDYQDDPPVRAIVVSYLTGILVNVLTALVGFRLLRQLRFSVREAVLGVLALMFCTTHLHYTQNLMENNYILLLTLTGFSFQYEWLRTGSVRSLFIGCGALGLNLLTRITTGPVSYTHLRTPKSLASERMIKAPTCKRYDAEQGQNRRRHIPRGEVGGKRHVCHQVDREYCASQRHKPEAQNDQHSNGINQNLRDVYKRQSFHRRFDCCCGFSVYRLEQRTQKALVKRRAPGKIRRQRRIQ